MRCRSRIHPLALSIFLSLLSCSERVSDTPSPGTLTVGYYVSGKMDGLNPILTHSVFHKLIFNGLVQVNDRLEMVPDLAESWEVSQDGLIWTFHLRKGIAFHDGVACTAEDVKFTYDTIMNPKVRSPRSPRFDQVEGVEIVDTHTIAIRLKQPYTPILESLSVSILPRHLLEGVDLRSAEFNRHPVGTGPFRLTQWASDERIAFEANENYFRGKPRLRQIVVAVYLDRTAPWVNLMKGKVDLVPYLLPEFLDIVSSDPTFTIYTGSYSFYYILLYNLGRPLFADRRVREAIAYGIDRQALIEEALSGQGEVATGPFLPGTWPCNPHVAPTPYAPDRADELLKEAGWHDADGDGFLEKGEQEFAFTVLIDQGDEMKDKAASMMRLQLEEIGVRMKVEVLPYAMMIKRLLTGNFDACFVQNNPGMDPDMASLFWHSGATYNFGSYENKHVDALLDLGRATTAPEKRRDIYQKVHALIVQDYPAAFLFYPKWLVVSTSRLKGTPNIGATDLFCSVETWYLANN